MYQVYSEFIFTLTTGNYLAESEITDTGVRKSHRYLTGESRLEIGKGNTLNDYESSREIGEAANR